MITNSDVLARLQVLEGPRGTSGQISTMIISVGFTILPFTPRSTSGVEVVEPLEPACSARPDFRAHPAARTKFSTPRITTSALLARDITIMLKHCSIEHHKRTLQRLGRRLHKLLNLVHTCTCIVDCIYFRKGALAVSVPFIRFMTYIVSAVQVKTFSRS